jgi:predicted metal-dependent HD superfamily phosphohydrolase
VAALTFKMNWPPPESWEELCRSAGSVKPFPEWYAHLTRAYNEPQRHYHNQQHIAECLAEFDAFSHLTSKPSATEFAIWFHDAIYDPKAADNEEKSAALAEECCGELGLNQAFTTEVARLIMATKTHRGEAEVEASLLIDIDLAILGKDANRFDEYDHQIRAEYAWVPVKTFAAKRVEILERFLSKPPIYSTPEFQSKYERQARVNLGAAINRWRSLP